MFLYTIFQAFRTWKFYLHISSYVNPRKIWWKLMKFNLYRTLLLVFWQLLGNSITPILKNLHWLHVFWRIQYKTLLLTWKGLNNMAPSYITELLSPYTPKCSLKLIRGATNKVFFGWSLLFCCCTKTAKFSTYWPGLLICDKLLLFIISSLDSELSYLTMPMSGKIYYKLYHVSHNHIMFNALLQFDSIFLVKGNK